MTKRKDRQYKGQKKGKTIQWPKERTDNTMAKRQTIQYNGQKKGQTIQWPKDRQYNGQNTDNTMTKSTSNDPQNTTQKTKD
jgi:hypothetical protein